MAVPLDDKPPSVADAVEAIDFEIEPEDASTPSVELAIAVPLLRFSAVMLDARAPSSVDAVPVRDCEPFPVETSEPRYDEAIAVEVPAFVATTLEDSEPSAPDTAEIDELFAAPDAEIAPSVLADAVERVSLTVDDEDRTPSDEAAIAAAVMTAVAWDTNAPSVLPATDVTDCVAEAESNIDASVEAIVAVFPDVAGV
jgi:hypothetical protein